MSDNQKYTAIKIRTCCTACGNDCGEHLITVGENIILCFACIDKTKEKVDLYRSELEEKEIEAMTLDVKEACYFHEIADARICADRLYKAGYRKVE